MSTSSLGVSFIAGRDNNGRPNNFSSFQVGLPAGFGGGSTIPTPLPIIDGGTNSTIPLNNNRLMVSLGGQIVEGTSSSSPVFTSINLTTLPISVTNNQSILYHDTLSGQVLRGLNVDQLISSRTNFSGGVVTCDGVQVGVNNLISVDSNLNIITLGNSSTSVVVPGNITVVDYEVVTNLQVTGGLTSLATNILANTTMLGSLLLAMTPLPTYLPSDRAVFTDVLGIVKIVPNMDNIVLARTEDEGAVLTLGPSNLISKSLLLQTSPTGVTCDIDFAVKGNIDNTANVNVGLDLQVIGLSVLLGGANIVSPLTLPTLQLDIPSNRHLLYYNTTSKEVTYGSVFTGAVFNGPIATVGPGSLLYQADVITTSDTEVTITGGLRVGGWASGLYEIQSNFTLGTSGSTTLPLQSTGAVLTPVVSSSLGVPDGITTFSFILGTVGWYDYQFFLQSTVPFTDAAGILMTATLSDPSITTIYQQDDMKYVEGQNFKCNGSFYNRNLGDVITFVVTNNTAAPITFGNATAGTPYRSFVSIKQTITS